ncbi:hypothetical protein BaRGS_00007012 [Batillaria attramentaria]|uniref:Uncharacterized protein n=1 Tax=Batillaria attramentaria TaxID=370345 RepID=A0ABD0LQ35_9CAEN
MPPDSDGVICNVSGQPTGVVIGFTIRNSDFGSIGVCQALKPFGVSRLIHVINYHGLFLSQPCVAHSPEVAVRAVYALEQNSPNSICRGAEKLSTGHAQEKANRCGGAHF